MTTPEAHTPKIITSSDVPRPSQTYPLPEVTTDAGWEFEEWNVEDITNTEADIRAAGATKQQQHQTSEILRTGKDGATEISYGFLVARDAYNELQIRKKMAEIAVKSPGTYEALRDGHVVGFHGTRSIALAGMMRTGKLMSARSVNGVAESDGIHMGSGEHGFQSAEGQESMSFSHLGALDSAGNYAGERVDATYTPDEVAERLRESIVGYAEYDGRTDRVGRIFQAAKKRTENALGIITNKPKGLEATLMLNDFPVLVGVSADFVMAAEDNPSPDVKHIRTHTGESSMGEFRPLATEAPLTALPVFAVPRVRMEGMQRLLRQFGHGNNVIPIEDLHITYPSEQFPQEEH
jgi:hypothetical protein